MQETDTQIKKNKHGKPWIDPLSESKECLVLDVATQKPLAYDERKKLLFLAPKGFYVFPSRRAAYDAVWHTKEKLRGEGVENPWELFEIVET